MDDGITRFINEKFNEKFSQLFNETINPLQRDVRDILGVLYDKEHSGKNSLVRQFDRFIIYFIGAVVVLGIFVAVSCVNLMMFTIMWARFFR